MTKSCKIKISVLTPLAPLSATPLSPSPQGGGEGAGRGANLKCNVCQNYLPGDQALWQAVGGSVEGGDSTCADAIFVRGGFCQHAYVYGCARVQRADKAMCVCVITYAAPPSPLYPPHACQMSCSTAQRKLSKIDSTFWTSPLRASPASRACDGGGPNLEKRFRPNEASARHVRWHGAGGRQREGVGSQ